MNLAKLLLLGSDVVIDKINKDIQIHLYDEYPSQKPLEMEKKQLPLMSKLKKK